MPNVLPRKLMTYTSEELERCLIQPQDPDVDRVYICSPLRGETPEETRENMLTARWYMMAVIMEGARPCAPHAYLPLLLYDNISKERELALSIGHLLLSTSNRLYVCGTRITDGMRGEIRMAILRGMPICVFHSEIRDGVSLIAQEEKREAHISLMETEVYKTPPTFQYHTTD